MSRPETNEQLLSEFKKLEHLNDGIPSVPVNIQDKDTLSLLNDVDQSFNDYLNRDNQNEDVVFVIGCDLGTSSTKIVIQQAFSDGRSIALPVPGPFRLDGVEQPHGKKSSRDTNGHPHCWKTLLYLDSKTETFSLLNGDGKKEINDIKTNVMRGTNQIVPPPSDIELTHKHAAAAYLGLILRYAKGWLYQHGWSEFGLDLKKYNIIWELNMGLPAVNLDDEKVCGRFHDILNASWLISEKNAPVTINMVFDHFSQATSSPDDFKELTNIRPEVTAEAVCLIESGLLDFKTYVLVDIGASTLDVCVFNYFDNIDSHKQSMLVAEVELLGAQSNEWLKQVSKPDGSAFSSEDLKNAIRYNIAKPIIDARNNKYPQSSVWSGKDSLEILMAGGGVASELHQTAIDDFKTDFTSGNNEKDVIPITPSMPKTLKHQASSEQAHRLAVAWGLSVKQPNFIKYDTPSKVSDIVMGKSSLNDTLISKDQV